MGFAAYGKLQRFKQFWRRGGGTCRRKTLRLELRKRSIPSCRTMHLTSKTDSLGPGEQSKNPRLLGRGSEDAMAQVIEFYIRIASEKVNGFLPPSGERSLSSLPK